MTQASPADHDPTRDTRAYPERPILAVSAAIIRAGKVLAVRRARMPAQGIFTLPGGVVEKGEMVTEALLREVAEETGLEIAPVGLAGFRDVIVRDAEQRIARHFVVLAFAVKWLGGEPVLNEELAEARWLPPDELATLPVTEGLGEIVASAFDLLNRHG